MSKWTTEKQRKTSILRNPKHIWIENYREKDRVPKHIFNSWTKEEQEFYYIFNGLYNHGYYPYECDLVPPKLVKEMQYDAKHRKQSDLYANGMKEAEYKLETNEWDEWIKMNMLHAPVLGDRDADTLARHGGIEYAIAVIAKKLNHLDGTLDTETRVNTEVFIRIIARIVNEERIYRGQSGVWCIPKAKVKELELTLKPSEIDNVSLKEAKRMLRISSFSDSITKVREELINRLQMMTQKTNNKKVKKARYYLIRTTGMLIAALIRKGERRNRYETSKRYLKRRET